MRLRLPRRRFWRGVIYLVCLVLVLLAIDLVLVQVRRSITPGFDTTRIISPVLADGRIDYVKALDDEGAEGVTPENNAAVPVLEALGRAGLPKTQPTDGITDKLGMAHLPEQGEYLISYDDFSKQQGAAARMGQSEPDLPTTWPPRIDPLTAKWVKANEHAMELLVEASNRTRFFIPFDGGNRPDVLPSVFLPHVRYFGDMGALLLTRAILRLQSGDVDGFEADLLATHRLARVLGKSRTAVERITARTQVEIPACEVDRLVAASGKLSAKQARALAAELSGLGDLPPMTDTINGERFMVLDVLQWLATLPPDQAARAFNGIMRSDQIEPEFAFRFAPFPFEDAMRYMNHFYDGAIAASRLSTYPQRNEAMKLWESWIGESTSRPFLVRILSPAMVAKDLLFSARRMEENDETSRAQMRLTVVALGLAAYRADHRAYPQNLAELSPDYLPTVPNDPFSEKSLIYAPTSKGYALRSVGPNMIDNNGSADDIRADLP